MFKLTLLVFAAILVVPASLAETASNGSRANAFFSTGNKLYRRGEYSKAVSYFHQALNFASKSTPPDHLNIAIAHNALGLAYERRGNRDKAIAHYANALTSISQAIKQRQARPKKKKRLFAFVLPKKKKPKPATAVPVRLVMANIYNNKAIAHLNKADYSTAITLLQNAIEIKRSVLGSDHPMLASSYSNLGLAYQKQHQHDKAALYHKKALTVQLKARAPGISAQKKKASGTSDTNRKPGPQHKLARSYINLGTAYLHQRKYDDAITYYRKGLPLLRQALGDKHPEVATAYSNLGVAYGRKGQAEQSIRYHQRALAIRLDKLRPLHPSTILSYRYLGLAYKKKGDTRKARANFKHGLAISTKGLGKTHRYTRFFASQLVRTKKTGKRTERRRKAAGRKQKTSAR